MYEPHKIGFTFISPSSFSLGRTMRCGVRLLAADPIEGNYKAYSDGCKSSHKIFWLRKNVQVSFLAKTNCCDCKLKSVLPVLNALTQAAKPKVSPGSPRKYWFGDELVTMHPRDTAIYSNEHHHDTLLKRNPRLTSGAFPASRVALPLPLSLEGHD